MSKELLIIFLYDCELCKTEEDDPQNAIIYFYPTWVNNEQRHALCSQLMGVTQFCSDAFTTPKLISLQSGKFSIKKLGRYALCVGTDRNIPDMVLQTRLNILYKLLRLFHYDIESLQTCLDDDDDNLNDKLSQLLQVYLPILQFATNSFGNIPTLKLPKSTSTPYLQAIQLLESFQEVPGVLGGTVLYQNKVVASQLDCDLTKQLVVTDPYRIKLPAQNVTTSFHLPVGVQLLNVYIEPSEVKRLRDENEQLLQMVDEVKHWREENQNQTNQNKHVKQSKEISMAVCNMKRDTSRIFTVPEEISEIEIENEIPDLVKDAVRARHISRIDAVVPSNFIVPEGVNNTKSLTTDDSSKTIHNVSIRYYSLGLPKLKPEWVDSPRESVDIRPYYNTISDPTYPLFRPNGLPASHLLNQVRLTGHYENLKSIESTPKKTRTRPKSIILEKEDQNKQLKRQKAKRAFSLPLNTNSDSHTMLASQGVPITPLMAKLSILAQEESQLETPCSLKTPGYNTSKNFKTFPKTPRYEVVQLSEEEQKTSEISANTEKLENVVNDGRAKNDLVPLALYVFGEHSTSVLLIIELSTATNPECIHSLWEISMNYLKKLETQLHKCLDHIALGPSGEYSYAVVDPSWGPIDRGGAYQPHQLELLTTLHFSLNERKDITDILVRGEDTISYGYQCGRNQIFYQQNCTTSAGLPTPADLMGIIPLKAKRTLERDHGIVLL